jgi:hypothetical protein
MLIICPDLKGQNIDKACNSSSEFSDILRNAFEVHMQQVYKDLSEEEIYVSFLNFYTFDPLIDSWIINISKTDVPDSLKMHSDFHKIWTQDQKESDILLEVVIDEKDELESEKIEIWDVDTESNYFKCLKESKSRKFVEFLDEIEAIGGFISQRLIASTLKNTLSTEDYSEIEIQNFIAINLYFTMLINLR